MPRSRRSMVPADIPPLPQEQGASREQLALWMKERFEKIEREHAERVELLRTVGEHPSPVFSRMAKNFGALGLPKSLAAKMLGISTTMLSAHYADDYDLGAAEILSHVAANMIRIAVSTDDPNAAKVGMDVLNRRGGEEWRPPAQKLEVSGKTDSPPVIDSSKLTFEERAQMRAMLERIAAGGEGDPPEEDPVIP